MHTTLISISTPDRRRRHLKSYSSRNRTYIIASGIHVSVSLRTLMDASPIPYLGGVVRSEQNWVGGNDWHPLDGDFVPPPAQMCGPLLADLVAYLRSEDHSPLLQSAVAHAQFETIHPFGDGNGRTGRALLYGVLKRKCAGDGMMPPVSMALSGNRDAYLNALAEFQTYVGEAHDPGRSRALIRWLEVLATAVQQSSASVIGYQKAIGILQRHWRSAVGGRAGRSVVAAAIDHLPANPSVTPKTLAEAIGFSERRCADALRRLKALGVVKDRTIGLSLRVYDADKVFDAFGVMSSTVCDLSYSDREYASILATPFLEVVHSYESAASEDLTIELCRLKVKSTGLPCGLAVNHRGHCRHLSGRGRYLE